MFPLTDSVTLSLLLPLHHRVWKSCIYSYLLRARYCFWFMQIYRQRQMQMYPSAGEIACHIMQGEEARRRYHPSTHSFRPAHRQSIPFCSLLMQFYHIRTFSPPYTQLNLKHNFSLYMICNMSWLIFPSFLISQLIFFLNPLFNPKFTFPTSFQFILSLTPPLLFLLTLYTHSLVHPTYTFSLPHIHSRSLPTPFTLPTCRLIEDLQRSLAFHGYRESTTFTQVSYGRSQAMCPRTRTRLFFTPTQMWLPWHPILYTCIPSNANTLPPQSCIL